MNSPPQSNKCEEKDEKGPWIDLRFDKTKIGQTKREQQEACLSAMECEEKDP